MNQIYTSLFLFSLIFVGMSLVNAQMENIQITADGRPVQVIADNPIVQVKPDAFVYGTLTTNESPQVTCQLQNCLYQVEQTGYGFNVRFSGLMNNYTSNVKIGDWLAVFVPQIQENKPMTQETNFNIQEIPNVVLIGAGLGISVIIIGLTVAKTRRGVKFL